jgi:hypothetical protein
MSAAAAAAALEEEPGPQQAASLRWGFMIIVGTVVACSDHGTSSFLTQVGFSPCDPFFPCQVGMQY